MNTIPVLNHDNPLRFALLGGSQVGKSSFVSMLSSGILPETHYPTVEFLSCLLKVQPSTTSSRVVLDELGSNKSLDKHGDKNVILSKAIFSQYNLNSHTVDHHPKIFESQGNNDKLNKLISKSVGGSKAGPHVQTKYYSYHPGSVAGYDDIPVTSPLLVELIDSPTFNPDLIVPFLELSLTAKIDDHFLDTPRIPVATKTLLVGSAAGELNGYIDGYFLMYSAVPSTTPPAYEGSIATVDSSFSLISSIRATILESWKSYRKYRLQHALHGETDVFSISSSFKHLWKNRITANELKGSEMPPIVIVCTHVNDEFASPVLIEQGKKLAVDWECSFVGIDCEDEASVERAMAVGIRDAIEKKKGQTKK